MKKKIKNGFSLIEMLLVIGVLSTLLVAAFVVYPRVKDSMNVSSEIKNLSLIQVGITNYFEIRGSDYSLLGSNTTTAGNVFANQARIVPSSMNNGNYNGSDIFNSWGGIVSIYGSQSSHSGFAGGRTFAIRYYDVPSSVCVNLVNEAQGLFTTIHVVKPVMDRNILNLNLLIEGCNSSEKVAITFIAR